MVERAEHEAHVVPQDATTANTADPLVESVNRITSMCPNCQENGETILLLHRVPHFKDLLISSFSCTHCNYSNREVQAAGSLAPHGIHITCMVTSSIDLNRQVVRSENCTVKIPEIELEIPPSKDRAELNTIEGFVASFAENLKCAALYQKQIQETETAEKLTQLVNKLNDMAKGKHPFIFELDDPSGNSYVESIDLATDKAEETNYKRQDRNSNSNAPLSATNTTSSAQDIVTERQTLRPSDDRLIVKYFERTREQLHTMGYYEAQTETQDTNNEAPGAEETKDNLEDEALMLPVECPHCGTSTTNKVCQVDIPGFRKCLIFAFSCPNCGAKNSEIKAAGAYGSAAKRWILTVETSEDLNRDVLKSDIASIEIPCLEFSMEGGAEAGTLTTVEGLIKSLADGLSESVPFASGDSAAEASKKKMAAVCEKLRKLQEGHPSVLPFNIIIDDPADMSFVALRREESKAEGKAAIVQVDASTHIDGDAAKALAAAAAAASRAPEAAMNEDELQERLKEAKPGEILWKCKLDQTLAIEVYKRTIDQEDSLGLLDMKV